MPAAVAAAGQRVVELHTGETFSVGTDTGQIVSRRTAGRGRSPMFLFCCGSALIVRLCPRRYGAVRREW